MIWAPSSELVQGARFYLHQPGTMCSRCLWHNDVKTTNLWPFSSREKEEEEGLRLLSATPGIILASDHDLGIFSSCTEPTWKEIFCFPPPLTDPIIRCVILPSMSRTTESIRPPSTSTDLQPAEERRIFGRTKCRKVLLQKKTDEVLSKIKE
jgi:hypothetical protein